MRTGCAMVRGRRVLQRGVAVLLFVGLSGVGMSQVAYAEPTPPPAQVAQASNPCAAKAKPANPCATKAANPCAAKPANPCAAKNPCAVKK